MPAVNVLTSRVKVRVTPLLPVDSMEGMEVKQIIPRYVICCIRRPVKNVMDGTVIKEEKDVPNCGLPNGNANVSI
jgi:hypothetical protein